MVKPKVVMTTNSLTLNLDEVFNKAAYKEVRHPVRLLTRLVGSPNFFVVNAEVPGHETPLPGGGHRRGGAQDGAIHHAVGRGVL